ncbi:MAG: metal-dependent transcriptional regulator [Chloroflexi bacterium]|nr:metal-dependent transcriptional regulator [Chloroflexota bacterium]
MRRYAAEVYRLQQDLPFVPLSALAEQAETSLQAASRMIRRLKDAGLIAHEPYQGVRLTPEGERIALPVIRRHRLTEVFLVQIMRFGWEEVHHLADALEPGINQVLEDRIDELTGHPTRCPHGEPIPSRDGKMPPLNDVRLIAVEPGTRGRLSRVRTHDPDKLRYLAELGLLPGVEIRLLARAPFNGPLRIGLGGEECVIGSELAAVLWIERQEPGEHTSSAQASR